MPSKYYEVVRPANLDEYLRLTNELAVRGDGPFHQYAFRGQSNEVWNLTPQVARLLQSSARQPERVHRPYPLTFESIAQRLFRAKAHLFLDVRRYIDPNSETDWLVLARHYGVPSRLLDWTYSPLVALYFACSSNDTSDGAVWCVSAMHVNSIQDCIGALIFGRHKRIDELLSGADGDGIAFFVPAAHNSRTAAQQGLMSVAGRPEVDHEDLLGAEIERHQKQPHVVGASEPSDHFKKIIIPAAQKAALRKALRMMNVRPEVLFPDLDGLGTGISQIVDSYGREYDESMCDAVQAVDVALRTRTDRPATPRAD